MRFVVLFVLAIILLTSTQAQQQPIIKPGQPQAFPPLQPTQPAQPAQPKTLPTPIEADIPPTRKYLESLTPASICTTQRFLSLQPFPGDYRDHAHRITTFVVNSLSWTSGKAELRVVPGTDNRVLVLDLLSVSRNSKDLQRWIDTWDLMTLADPYYSPAWCNFDDCKAINDLTGSVGPILRADFFCFYATLGDNKETKDAIEGFYDRFLDLPENEEQLLKLLDVRLDRIAYNGTDRKAGVTQSGSFEKTEGKPVALNNRYLNRYPTSMRPRGGYLWATQDYINSTGNRDIYFDVLSEAKDGGELIFSLPNGLQGYALLAAKKINGKNQFVLINEVPTNIATDKNFRHHTVKLSTCTACHPVGINSFKCVIANELFLPAAPGGVVLPVENKPFAVARKNQLYKEDIPYIVAADQTDYIAAVAYITGYEPKVIQTTFVANYMSMLNRYENPVTAIQACWDFGTPEATQLSIEEYLADKVVSTTRGELLAIVKGGVLNRDTFEQEYPNGKLLQSVKENILRKSGKPKINLVVPSTVTGTLATLVIPLDSQWKIRITDEKGVAKEWGPINDDVLGRWFLEGRIKKDTELMDMQQKSYKPASEMFPSHFNSIQLQQLKIPQIPNTKKENQGTKESSQ